ncbi:MAG: flippase [Thermoplasmata archaeon]
MNEAGRLGRNFSAIAIAQLIGQVLTFIVSVFLARTLGVELYGIFVFGFAFPNLFLLVVSLGLDSVLTIDVAADRTRGGSYLTVIATLRIALLLLAMGVLWVSVELVLTDPFAKTVTLILGVASLIGTYAGTFDAMFRAYERLEYSAIVTIIERATTTAAILVLIVFGFGLVEISLVFVAGSIISLVLSILILRMRIEWFRRGIRLGLWKRILRRTIPFALAAVVSTFMFSIGPVLLTILRDPIQTGQFNAAFALTLALFAPLNIYNIVFLPAMSRIFKNEPGQLSAILRKSQKLFFILGLPIAVGGWFFATDLVTLIYGGEFFASASSLRILLFVLAVATAQLGTGTALAVSGHQPLNLVNGAMGTATIVGLSFLLIPQWGHVGASFAFTAANVVMAIFGMAAVHLLVARLNIVETLPRPIIAGLVMMLTLVLLPELPLWWGVPVGGAVYFLVLFAVRGVTREDLSLVREALRGVFRRRRRGEF